MFDFAFYDILPVNVTILCKEFFIWKETPMDPNNNKNNKNNKNGRNLRGVLVLLAWAVVLTLSLIHI